MIDWRKLKIPAKERLHVRIYSGKEPDNELLQIITSLFRGMDGKIPLYTWKLYDVSAAGLLTLAEKNNDGPYFEKERC